MLWSKQKFRFTGSPDLQFPFPISVTTTLIQFIAQAKSPGVWMPGWVQLFATLWTIVHQAPLSMGFSKQEYLSGEQCPPPGIVLTQGSNPGFLHCRQILCRWSQQRSLSVYQPKKSQKLVDWQIPGQISFQLQVLLLDLDSAFLSPYPMLTIF